MDVLGKFILSEGGNHRTSWSLPDTAREQSRGQKVGFLLQGFDTLGNLWRGRFEQLLMACGTGRDSVVLGLGSGLREGVNNPCIFAVERSLGGYFKIAIEGSREREKMLNQKYDIELPESRSLPILGCLTTTRVSSRN
jgi:hypothetical protein